MRITELSVRTVTDSRGEPTIAVTLATDKGVGEASIPSGMSVGAHEAKVLSPDDAMRAGRSIADALSEKDFNAILELDRFLVSLDRTPQKEKLGGNTILGVSLAFARARAVAENRELWEILREEYFPDLKTAPAPRIFANLINGGSHAKSNLTLQEYLVVAKPYPSVSDTIRGLKEINAALGNMLAMRFPGTAIGVGDEGGYVLNFRDDREPLEILGELLQASRRDDMWFLGLDAAASSFFAGGKYRLGAENLSAQELAARYVSYHETVPLLKSIEDPFAEEAIEEFAAFQKKNPELLVVGDDLTATNAERIARSAAKGALKGVIIKPNQAGTVTETCEAMRAAMKRDLTVIVSHRSGETPDPFLIHFAKAGNAYGVKIGAPASHRLPRYHELARLYKE